VKIVAALREERQLERDCGTGGDAGAEDDRPRSNAGARTYAQRLGGGREGRVLIGARYLGSA
jgi:hypothetical protein